MSFKKDEVADLLVRCKRSCCICHRFCGIKIETDHIEPKGVSHDNSIENAIPLCFDCHAEVHFYNDSHPRGRKYSTQELKWHKDKWLKICETNHPMDNNTIPKNETLLSLIDELEFNKIIAENKGYITIPFEVKQFHTVMNSGILSFLDSSLKESIFATYATLKEANRLQADMIRTSEKHPGLIPVIGSSRSKYEEALKISIKSICITLNKINKTNE